MPDEPGAAQLTLAYTVEPRERIQEHCQWRTHKTNIQIYIYAQICTQNLYECVFELWTHVHTARYTVTIAYHAYMQCHIRIHLHPKPIK